MTNRFLISVTLFVCASSAQHIEVREAPKVTMPGQVDSNSPAFWMDGQLHLFNSTGDGPLLSRGPNQFRLSGAKMSHIVRLRQWPAWIEAVWVDPSGVILGWYHQEHEHICGAQRPAQPHIGAAISYDRGQTFHDVGVILSSGVAADCKSKNGYFAGGHGDFSVVLDRSREYFYFFFGNYGGPAAEQGISVARMAYDQRFNPVGAVRKYRDGDWRERGIGGRTTPIFGAKVDWQSENTDSYWGPSVHWNTYLRKFVMLMNRSCCTTGWPQEGIYAAFSDDMAGWTEPRKILDHPGWYPQVLGIGPGGTDTVAGRIARLYVYGESYWDLVFRRDAPAETVPESR